MIIPIDLTTVEDKDFEPIPAGNYVVRVLEATEKSSAKGKYIKLTLEVTEGEYAGRKLFHNLSELPQSLWNLKRFLDAAGVEYGEEGFATEDIQGAELEVSVVQEPYNDKITNKVKGYLPIG